MAKPFSAECILLRIVANFPGLVDGETEVPGAELVEWVANEVHGLQETNPELYLQLKAWAEDTIPF